MNEQTYSIIVATAINMRAQQTLPMRSCYTHMHFIFKNYYSYYQTFK